MGGREGRREGREEGGKEGKKWREDVIGAKTKSEIYKWF